MLTHSADPLGGSMVVLLFLDHLNKMEPFLETKVTRESIDACLELLIRKYHDLPQKHRENMSEQDVRDYFVTPLLEALGWGTVDPRERAAEKYLPKHGFSDYELCLPIGSKSEEVR